MASRASNAAKKVEAARFQEVPKAAAPAPGDEEIRREVAEAAYYRAMQRGFTPGFELDDWLQAESEVLQRRGARPEVG
jgi:hypothetical protein